MMEYSPRKLMLYDATMQCLHANGGLLASSYIQSLFYLVLIYVELLICFWFSGHLE